MPHMEVIPIIIVLHTQGVHHVLKPILESTIKVDIFPAVKKRKKDSPMDTPKPRTALFQEGGNDETSIGDANKSKSSDIPSKPRMALIQGREDHELMTPQIILTSNQMQQARKYYKEYDKLGCDLINMWRRPASIGIVLQICINCQNYIRESAHKSNLEFSLGPVQN
jgi:hypothetical protein